MFRKLFSLAKKKKLIISSLFISALLIFLIIKTISSSRKEKYQFSLAEKKDLPLTVSASGKIKSDEEATLKFQTSGQLAWVGIKKGDKVKKWQAIASLDKKELEKKLKQELLDYMNERWDFEQTTLDDYQDMALTETIRRAKEKAQFDLDRTVLDVQIADIALKYATLISPIEGIVTKIDAPYPGINITPATAEFVISNPNKLVFSANVDEVDIGKVRKGQKATLILDAYPEEKIQTQVKEVEFTSTLTSGGGTAFATKFKLPADNENEKFKIGMNGDVEILVEEKENILVVPFEAVQEDSYVWLLRNDKPVKQTVKTGYSDDVYTQIINGLKEGDKVIVSGFKNLKKEAR